jgi:hypothetical protein
MIKRYLQKHTDVDSAGLGDCFSACVACILDLPQDVVPLFCAWEGHWFWQFQEWLEMFHLTAIELNMQQRCMCPVTPGVPCILTGKSPRGSWLHAVVATTDRGGFNFYHDPHPDGNFLDGEPKYVLFFAPLRPDRAWRRK